MLRLGCHVEPLLVAARISVASPASSRLRESVADGLADCLARQQPGKPGPIL